MGLVMDNFVGRWTEIPIFHFKKETKITCGDKSVVREKT